MFKMQKIKYINKVTRVTMPIGSLLQLSSANLHARAKKGKDPTRIHQEAHLTETPSKNFFKLSYKQFYNFAKYSHTFQFQEQVDFGKKLTTQIVNYGDYLSNVYFRITVPALVATSGTYAGWTQSFAQALVEYAEFKINGITFEKIYGMYMDIYDEIALNEEYRTVQNLMIGRAESLTLLETNATAEKEFLLKIPFSFTRDIERSIPLVLLQKSKIEVEVKLRPFSEVVTFDGATPPETVRITLAELEVDMYYLDEKFRKKLVQEAKDRNNETVMMYEQVQYCGDISIAAGQQSVKTSLPFNNPMKEILVVTVEEASKDNNDWFNYARRADASKQIENIRLLLDNEDRFDPNLPESNFRLLTPRMHHTRSTNRFIYCLPLSERPEEYQPSGSLNASRFDDVSLLLTLRDGNLATNLYTFAVSYQLLVIIDGMAGIGWRD